MEKDNRQNGFTLIEVLIAITLLVIGILAAGAMQISSLGGNSNAIRLTEAATWAGDKLEDLMSRTYTHADLADDNGDGVAGLSNIANADSLVAGAPAAGDIHGGFTVYWNVAEDYPIRDCKTIRVLVRRTDKGIMKTVSLDFTKMRSI